MRKQLYLDIQDKLKAIKDDSGMQLLQHFDLWNQQVNFIEAESPFNFPAVFVEFMPHQWQTLGNKVQQAEIVIRLHIVTKWFAQTAEYSPLQSEALDYLDLPDKLFAAMQSNATSASNGFMRLSSTVNHNHEGIVDTIEEYKTLIVDRSAVTSQTPLTNTTPVINIP
ncbi:MAG TPA: hypothetical protein PLC48_08875 [Ferruginibacter sp.]|jgi:hypothetical protein|nr:hypothetical protein [Bacteroidales bacterium]HPH85563.1 hypothetical protein [Ferruginibacter sp.]